MKLLIDDANIQAIRELYEFYPIDGVTTNPSILAKAGRPPFAVLREIRDFIGPEADLHVQAVAPTAEGMAEDARRITGELGEKTLVKIPCIPEGFKAMKALRELGVRTTGTAVYTPMQAFLAARCGAEYVAPYINRIDNMGFDGIAVAREIQDIFARNGMSASILAASFKNSQQVLELCKYGVGAATAAPDVIRTLVKNPAIDTAVDAFVSDFEKLTGVRAMTDCE